MPNLLSSLLSSTGALTAYDRVLEVVQNNVSNASTPGYAKQTLRLASMPFNPEEGTTGGVRAGEVVSARDEYAEQAVRRQEFGQGEYDQQVASLTALQSEFDISGAKGIPAAMNRLFQAFSAWSQNPTGTVPRQDVVDRASQVAQAFQQSAAGLQNQVRDNEAQLRQTIDQVNKITKELQGYNIEARQGNRNDPGLDARVHTSLEELAQYVSFSSVKESDGAISLLLDGSVPLLVGDKQYPLTFKLAQPAAPPPVNASGPATASILASDGSEITGKISTGKLGALLDVHNRVMAGFLGDSQQPGELNRLAQAFADRVNAVLTAGYTTEGPPPEQGAPMFAYDQTNVTGIARSLKIADGFSGKDLAAIEIGDSTVSNGVPLRLSALATPQDTADEIDGFSFSEYYGVLAGRVGSALSDAETSQQVQQSLVAQSKDLRQQTSGVSLDEEAALLIQFQRGYQANAQLIKVLNELTQTTIDIMR